MKKLLIVFIVFLLAGCVTVPIKTTPIIDKTEISIRNFIGTCGSPAESYFIQRLGVKVHRHNNCMGVTDLLSLIWAEDKLTKQSIDGIAILAITYMTHLNRRDPSSRYAIGLLKIDSFTQRNIRTHIAFFKIIRKPKK